MFGGGIRVILFGVTNPMAPHDWPQTMPILDGLTNPAPFRVVVFRVHTIDRGYLAGHARTLAVVMAWKCSHVRPFVLGRRCSLWPAHRGGFRWPLVLRLLAF